MYVFEGIRTALWHWTGDNSVAVFADALARITTLVESLYIYVQQISCTRVTVHQSIVYKCQMS